MALKASPKRVWNKPWTRFKIESLAGFACTEQRHHMASWMFLVGVNNNQKTQREQQTQPSAQGHSLKDHEIHTSSCYSTKDPEPCSSRPPTVQLHGAKRLLGSMKPGWLVSMSMTHIVCDTQCVCVCHTLGSKGFPLSHSHPFHCSRGVRLDTST